MRRRTPRHEIRALLRAHLAAASGYRHLTRHCAVCARLLRLAMDPLTASGATGTAATALAGPGPHEPALAGPASPAPPGTAPVPPAASGSRAAAPAPPAASGSSGAAPPAVAAPEPPPEQTGVHVMASAAREQTVQPVTGPGPAPSPTSGALSVPSPAAGPGPLPSPATGARPVPPPAAGPPSTRFAAPDTGPHALARRPAPARTATRLAPARASASPGGGDPGPGGRRGPGWTQDESPPAA
ncbi:DUF6274 family protein [Streptomyces sp. OR43]|uniref:DUF6274 family protein n=1 Tax=Streptomyces sp. or43 TaxID=2478957 RepID=UPI0021C66528|nr:DUF6274 family protein [Streptomyces sp. or43]